MTDPTQGAGPPVPEADLRELVDHIPAAILVLANVPTVSIVYASAHIERLTGYPVDAWLDDPELSTRVVHPADRERVLEGWATSVGDAAPFTQEFRVITREGSIVWIRAEAEPIRDERGDVVSWHGIVTDITSRMAAEDALTRSEARYRALVERLPAVVYVDSDDIRPRSLYVSPNSEDVLGYAPSTYLGDSELWTRSIHPDDRTAVAHAWSAVIVNRQPFHAEYRVVRPDGAVVWVRDSSIPVHDEEGSTLFWQGVMLDITSQKIVEEALRLSEVRYRLLVEQVPAVVYEMDRDDERRTLYVSPHVEEILGYTRQEWLDQPDIWTELLHEDDREIELAAHDRHTETGEPWSREYRLIASDGRVVWVRDQARLMRDGDPGSARWQGVMLDITPQKEAERALREANDELELGVLARTTELADANEMMSLEIGERKRVEAELREAEMRYRLLIEDLPAAVYTWEANWNDEDADPNAPLPYMSPQIESIVGYTSAEWGQTGFWRTRLHPHDRDRILAASAHSAETGEPFNVEHRYLAKDGRIVWVLDRATIRTRDEHGVPATFQGIMLDVTARKEAQAKAAEVEARYRLITEQGPVMSYICRLDQDVEPPGLLVEFISPQTADVVGYPIDHWVGRPDRWFEMIHPDDRGVVERVMDNLRLAGEPWSNHYRVIAGDGQIIWLKDQGLVVERDAEGRPSRFQGVLQDVTEERERLQELEVSERAFREMVESSSVVTWTEVVDRDTGRARYTYIGPQVQELLGYSPTELMDEPDHFDRLVHPDDRARVATDSDRSAEALVPWEDEYRVIARDGSVRVVHATARPGPIDQVANTVTWFGVSVDVTAHRDLTRQASLEARAER